MIPKALFVGITTIDLHFHTSEFPALNSKTRSSGFSLNTGGPATNAAATFSHLGGLSVLFSVVGKNHPLSDFIYNDLKTFEIQHIDLGPESERLPTVATVITPANSGERNRSYLKSQPQARIPLGKFTIGGRPRPGKGEL